MTDDAARAALIVTAWAESVLRLIEKAPIKAVVEEVGCPESGHSTPPERAAIRAEARAIVQRWLARDLALLEDSHDR